MAEAVMAHVLPRVQVWPLTVVAEFTRSLFVTRPSAVKLVVTVNPDIVGKDASTMPPDPVTDSASAAATPAPRPVIPLIGSPVAKVSVPDVGVPRAPL